MIPWRPEQSKWFLLPFILLFFYLSLSSLINDSPTMDEQNHLGRGAAFVRSGDPRLSLEHPPLVNALSALPLLIMPNLTVPFDHPSWQLEPPDTYWYVFANQLVWLVGNDVSLMLFLARLPIVFMTLGLALVGFHFARLVWQRPLPAILTFIMLLFDPNVMANGRYVTTDLGGTLFLFLATLLLWRMWQHDKWDWQAWAWAGFGMGLAFGSKLSTLVFVPIWGVLALLPLYKTSGFNNQLAAQRRLIQLVTAGFLSIFVVWIIFGFEWRPFRFASTNLVGLNTFSGPMPTFWAGIEKISLLSGGGRGAFLLGDFSVDGFAAYFPVAFLAKTPLPTLLGLLVAIGFLFWQPLTRQRAWFLLLPALLYFAATVQSNLNIGYRHLLPMLPFIYLFIAGLVVDRVKWRLVVGWGTAVLLIFITLVIHPHYLSYFNQAVGGPENGYNLLVDSNIDWGQDLLRLQTWMADAGVSSVKLGYFGSADPVYYGLINEPLPGFPRPEYLSQWTDPPFNPSFPEPGIYAISVSSLMELPLPQSNVYAWFRQQEPDARIGYSILIYQVKVK